MGKIVYTQIDVTLASDATQDIWSLMAPAGNKLKLHGWELYSPIIAAETVNLRLVRRSTTGDGGTAVEVLGDPDSSPVLSVVETLALAPGTIGDILQEFEWEQLGPLGQLYTPEMRPIITDSTSSFLCLNLQTALAGTTQWKGWICFEEI